MQWFAVDKQGLAKLLERKGKAFMLYELVQNAWDENTTQVDVTLKPGPDGLTELTVRDNNPTGFSNLSYAFTLFAESDKKASATQRGRFNLGEKLVLALCEKAQIASTTGTVNFDQRGRQSLPSKTETGSAFTGYLKLTAEERDEFETAARRLLPPVGILTTFNGSIIANRPVKVRLSDVALPTELGDQNGVLRPTVRNTTVEIVEPLPGEGAMLYEMGIPVVEVDMPWHVNIGQKVPLNMDRDNVTPAYLGRVRSIVAQAMISALTPEQANSTWVRDAVTRHGDTMSPETITALVEKRFGEKRVAYDPTDPEANALAVTAGYTVVHGGSLNKAEWSAARRVGAILPAGKVTPSPKPFKEGGEKLQLQKELTPAQVQFVEYAKRIGQALLGGPVSVRVANDPSWRFVGCYGGRELTVNTAVVGYEWFEGVEKGQLAKINDFLIHEFGHEYCGNHLSEAYYDALTMLGGKLVQLALDKPALFKA